MVSEGAAERGKRALRAELALKTPTPDLDPRERQRRVLEQALVFAGASVVAVYSPTESGDELYLSESAGVPRTLYGLRDSYVLTGGSPAVDAYRSGRPLWLGPAEIARCADARRLPSQDFWLAVLPLPDGGCLVAAGERPGGFDEEDRECLGLIAEAAVVPVPGSPRATAARPTSSFDLAMDTGHLEVDGELLELFGLDAAEFDGKVESLLSMTVPEDLPALMSVVEADHMSIGDRELEFRILQPSGEPKWLRLRGRLVPGGEGRPAHLVGTVADASKLRSGVSDVARVQRLASTLAIAGTVRDVGRAVVAALRAPCGPTGSPSPSWRATVSSSPSWTLPSPKPGPRCGAPSGARSGPTRPYAPCPRWRRPSSRGVPPSGPPEHPWNRRSPTSAPAVSPSCRCPQAAGWRVPA